MTDLATMMRDQAVRGLQAQLDAAVTEGNTEAARKISDDIAKLAVSTAPKAAPYGDAEIRGHLDKQAWFGTDPKRSAKALEFGKTMDPKKFSTAEAFATAIVKAVDEEFKPAATPKKDVDADDDPAADDDPDTDDDPDADDAEGKSKKPDKSRRRTDAPGEADATNRTPRRASSGPWTKLSEAPKEVQAEIKRSADKFVPANAPKERRETYIAKALESHYAMHQRNAKGKK